jgi:hypothetical protein
VKTTIFSIDTFWEPLYNGVVKTFEVAAVWRLQKRKKAKTPRKLNQKSDERAIFRLFLRPEQGVMKALTTPRNRPMPVPDFFLRQARAAVGSKHWKEMP